MTETGRGSDTWPVLPMGQDDYRQYSEQGIQHTERLHKKLIEIAEGAHDHQGGLAVLTALESLLVVLDQQLNLSGLYSSVHPDAGLRRQAEHTEQHLRAISDGLSLSGPLYRALGYLKPEHLDEVTLYYVQKWRQELERSGVHLAESTRNRVLSLRAELVQLGQTFSRHIREDTREIHVLANGLGGLPEDYRSTHLPNAQGLIRISTDYPDMIPFMTYAEQDDARLALFIQARQRGYPKNIEVLNQIIQRRQDLAVLLGFPNYAEYVTADKMVGNATRVGEFIEKAADLAGARAKKELALLERFSVEPGPIGEWQRSYLENKYREETFHISFKEVRDYFGYRRVRDGLFALVEELFQLKIDRASDAPVWDKDVEAYRLFNSKDHTLLGVFYLDMHPRVDKYKHAAMFPIQTGTTSGGLAIAALVCNFSGGSAAVMEHDEVVTFFHEFGHLLHHMLARGPRVGQGGISTEWDFVEAPSQFFEEWAYQPSILARFAQNARGQTMSEDGLKKLVESKRMGRGIQVRQQMFYAALSLQVHQADRISVGHLDDLVEELQRRYSVFQPVSGTHFHLSFDHLEGYSALYYTYMWSLSIAKDLFSVFQQAGILNKELALHYRKTILEPGGQKPAAQLIEDFLGRAFSLSAFEKWLKQH